MDASEVRRLVEVAEHDERACRARESIVRALGPAFRRAGNTLWVGGYLLGKDRVENKSPFSFGSDATVGLATVAQTAGELCAGAVLLLEHNNVYGAAALVRQLVETEYLAWAFAEADEEASAWLRSTKEERLKQWQPRHLRERAGDRFRARDYSMHCELGGHPTPQGTRLLPDHIRLSNILWWYDLAMHGTSAWDYALVAAERLGYGEAFRDAEESRTVEHATHEWRAADRLPDLLTVFSSE
jgi:hypothetical protein